MFWPAISFASLSAYADTIHQLIRVGTQFGVAQVITSTLTWHTQPIAPTHSAVHDALAMFAAGASVDIDRKQHSINGLHVLIITCDRTDLCGGRGLCRDDGIVECTNCAVGWSGPTCSTCDPAEPVACGNRGTCTSSTGTCSCHASGWGGIDCMTPVPSVAPPRCEDPDMYGPSCDRRCVSGITCNGRGLCGVDGRCLCQLGWDGDHCEHAMQCRGGLTSTVRGYNVFLFNSFENRGWSYVGGYVDESRTILLTISTFPSSPQQRPCTDCC